MSDYRDRNDADRRGRQGGFDRRAHLDAEAQARANAAGTYPGPSRTAGGQRQGTRQRDDRRMRTAEDRVRSPRTNDQARRRAAGEADRDARRSQARRDAAGFDRSQQGQQQRQGQQRRRAAEGARDDARRSASAGRGQRRGEAEANRDRQARQGERRTRPKDARARGARRSADGHRSAPDQLRERDGRTAAAPRDDSRAARNRNAATRRPRQGTAPQDGQRIGRNQGEARDRSAQQDRRAAAPQEPRPQDPRTRQQAAREEGRSRQTLHDGRQAAGEQTRNRLELRDDGRRATGEQARSRQEMREGRQAAGAPAPQAAAGASSRAGAETGAVTSDGSPAFEAALEPSKRARLAGAREVSIIAFHGVLTLGLVLGLCFFMRPSVSQAENRELTKIPQLSMQSFLDGDFTDGVSTWYADTFPFRDRLMGVNQLLGRFAGVQPSTQLIGGNRSSDQLPQEANLNETKKPTHSHDATAPETRIASGDLEDQITNGVYIADGACYTLYYFDDDATREYAGVINDAAELLGDDVTVYSILIPTNAGVMLDDSVLANLGVPNQGQAIEYFYSLMTDDVVTVPTFEVLREHRDEYIYFRTDHHWTQLGSYYIYRNFCDVKGVNPEPVLAWEKMTFEPFWGEYSTVTDLSRFEPDSVEAYIPADTNEITFWIDDLDLTNSTQGNIVADFSGMSDDDMNKYNCFVCGNQPLSYIENPNVADGSSCLVIKDSFGNPLVATMVDNYQYIYTVDFRYTDQKLLDLVRRYEIHDVIFENTIMFAGTYDAVDLLSNIVYPEEIEEDKRSSGNINATDITGE